VERRRSLESDGLQTTSQQQIFTNFHVHGQLGMKWSFFTSSET
jgi:hypothetical protein